MRLVSKTNTQMPSGSRLYYKAFAATKSCLHASFAARIGLDWADKKHFWTMQTADGKRTRGELKHSPEAIEAWVADLTQRFGDQPIAVALEQARGSLIAILSKYANLHLFIVDPSRLAH